MRVLVTGGAGYVGSHAAKFLAAAGHDVWIVDNLSEGHRAAVGKLPLATVDLNDQKAITDLLKSNRIEAVMHFAAFAYVGDSVARAGQVLPKQHRRHPRLARRHARRRRQTLVFSSTCATYGMPTKVPITEDHPQNPINPYGFTKLAIEHALADYSHAYGLGFAALRYFNAAGAAADGTIGEDHDPETHLIPLVLQVALGQRESVDLFGTDYPTPDGTCVRDYIHVDDLAAAHVLAIEKLTPGKALKLNLGTGRGASVQEVVDIARAVTGHKIPTRPCPRREGDPPELVANPESAKRELGWVAKHKDMRGIIESAWRWHKSHPHGYGN